MVTAWQGTWSFAIWVLHFYKCNVCHQNLLHWYKICLRILYHIFRNQNLHLSNKGSDYLSHKHKMHQFWPFQENFLRKWVLSFSSWYKFDTVLITVSLHYFLLFNLSIGSEHPRVIIKVFLQSCLLLILIFYWYFHFWKKTNYFS